MAKKGRLRNMFKKLVSISTALLLPLMLTGCECLWAWTELYVNRNVPATELDFLPVKEVYICAGEAALLRWTSHKRLTQAWLTEVGEVEPQGQVVVAPPHTTDYTLTAEGADCRARSTVTVHVVRPGDMVHLDANEIYDPGTGSYYWQVEVKEQIFSPNIVVNSIQAERRTDEVGPWTVSKMDPDGLVHEVIVPQDRPVSPEEPFSIIGAWSLWPEKQYQGTATLILRIKCRE